MTKMQELAQRIEAVLAEIVADQGPREFAAAFGLFLAENPGALGRAVAAAPDDQLVGLVMKNSGGSADPAVVRTVIKALRGEKVSFARDLGRKAPNLGAVPDTLRDT